MVYFNDLQDLGPLISSKNRNCIYCLTVTTDQRKSSQDTDTKRYFKLKEDSVLMPHLGVIATAFGV
jgi:hypothetical protein